MASEVDDGCLILTVELAWGVNSNIGCCLPCWIASVVTL